MVAALGQPEPEGLRGGDGPVHLLAGVHHHVVELRHDGRVRPVLGALAGAKLCGGLEPAGGARSIPQPQGYGGPFLALRAGAAALPTIALLPKGLLF